MFGKKGCKKCGERIAKKYLFCPNCGNLLNKKKIKEDFGMLGKDDFVNEFENFQSSIFGGAGEKVLGKMLKSTMRMLEKEMKKEFKRKNNGNIKNPRTNFQLFINGERIDNFQTNRHTHQKIKKQKKEISSNNLPQNHLKKFSKLPKNEPKTNVRRFSDKVIYEINIPGVKSIKDVSIIKLENNIEIKAITKDKAYNKLIPFNFPITDYNFSRGKLILELDSKE
ncbi:MAG: zinc ribbon domain-containing protein [Nanoarchaeota archaeon]|nr:zinc ribbon domain-containing protein [Nanoarchaeota archaeon]